jgi:hypothetical protein
VRRALRPEVRARVAALEAPDGALRACEELEAWAAGRRTAAG